MQIKFIRLNPRSHSAVLTGSTSTAVLAVVSSLTPGALEEPKSVLSYAARESSGAMQ